MMALRLVTSLLQEAEHRLSPTFGLAELRAWQRDAMGALLDGSGRVLVVAPTGGGKSLTYQLPATVLQISEAPPFAKLRSRFGPP